MRPSTVERFSKGIEDGDRSLFGARGREFGQQTMPPSIYRSGIHKSSGSSVRHISVLISSTPLHNLAITRKRTPTLLSTASSGRLISVGSSGLRIVSQGLVIRSASSRSRLGRSTTTDGGVGDRVRLGVRRSRREILSTRGDGGAGAYVLASGVVGKESSALRVRARLGGRGMGATWDGGRGVRHRSCRRGSRRLVHMEEGLSATDSVLIMTGSHTH